MNRTSRIALSTTLAVFGSIAAGHATATTTTANAAAFVSGTTQRDSVTAGAQGARASADQVIPSPIGDVFVSAQASSLPGSLRAAGVARTGGSPGGFQAQASASWADAFVISAPGHDSSMTGTFGGAVRVTGELSVEFVGRVYADSQVHATVDLFPGTGFNGGRTVVNGSARNLVGYDIPGTLNGTEGFTLVFSGVPFTFGQNISVSLGLAVSADVNAIDAGATGRSVADYSNTMTWLGLAEVRDQSGTVLTDYSALSPDSNFNFASPAAVPEPSSALLLVAGLFLMGAYARKPVRSSASMRAFRA